MVGAGCIPYAEILAYLRLHHIAQSQWQRLTWGIEILDHAWQEKMAEREAAKRTQQGTQQEKQVATHARA
jgi:hypothetical protein